MLLLVAAALAWPTVVTANDGGEAGMPQGYSVPAGALMAGAAGSAAAASSRRKSGAARRPPEDRPQDAPFAESQAPAYDPGGFQQGI